MMAKGSGGWTACTTHATNENGTRLPVVSIKMLKRAGSGIAVYLAIASCSPAAAALRDMAVEIFPAWNGFAVPGKTTEVAVRLTAREDGQAIVRVRSAEMISHAKVRLAADQAQVTRLPLTAPLSGGKLAIEIALEEGAEPRIEQWSPTWITDTPLVATTTDQVWRALADNPSRSYTARIVTARGLPRTPHGYGTVDALIIDQSGLTRLDAQQLSALFAFLGGCGRLVAWDMTPDIAARLGAAAGCDRQFFSHVQSVEGLRAALTRMLPLQPVALPTGARLSSLLDSSSGQSITGTVALFLAAYCVLMWVAARAAFPAWVVLLLPPAASLAVPLIWLGRAPELVSVGWAEMWSDDRVARTATLVQLHGAGRGTGELSLPAVGGLPVAQIASPQRPLRLELGNDALTVRVPVRLLAREELLFTGVTELVPPIRVTLDAGGPRVRNTSAQATRSGFLFWNDQQFTLPALPPGAQWSTQGVSPSRSANPVSGWLRTQTPKRTVAILLRLPRPAGDELTGPAPADTQWLLVRAGAAHATAPAGRT